MGKKKIILMDDDLMIQNVTGKMISALGYEVDFAVNGEELLEKFAAANREGRLYDAVIMDLGIDLGMDAETVMPILLEKYPDVKVIVSSGNNYSPMVTKYADYGFRGVLNKPYRLNILAETLEKIVGE